MVLMDIYDKKAEIHSYSVSDSLPSFIRSLKMLPEETLPRKFPSDFEVYEVLAFDSDVAFPRVDLKAKYKVANAPQFLGTVEEVLNRE